MSWGWFIAGALVGGVFVVGWVFWQTRDVDEEDDGDE